MQVQHIPLTHTGQMSQLSQAYLSGKPDIRKYHQWEFSEEGFTEAIKARKAKGCDRALLNQRLKAQYEKLDPQFFQQEGNRKVQQHIELLQNDNAFTITTGHQLNIFTGPLYFIYKIVSAIKLSRQLKEKFPESDFVPVYWMASEDHDFAEINHIHYAGRTLSWEREEGGAVGRMSPTGLDALAKEIEELAGNRPFAEDLGKLLEEYTRQPHLALATRKLVHSLFADYGLLIIDADDAELKSALIPVLEKDLQEQVFHKKVMEASAELEKSYKLPVTPRGINIFYLEENKRNRIVKEGERYAVLESGKSWSTEELQAEVTGHPERFSPNVVLRPMYQEIILPNIAYIGGNNEIAYWLQLKSAFEAADVYFPVLVVRDSVVWIGKRAAKDMEQLSLQPEDLFLKLDELKQRFYEAQDLEHPAEATAEHLLQQYDKLRDDLQSLDKGFVAGVVKQMNQHQKDLKKWKGEIKKKQLENEEKNLQKLEKLYNTIYPEGVFQERYDNFIQYYLIYGPEYIEILLQHLDPLSASLHVISEA